MDWFAAERLCIARGGTLATILSLEEDNFMLDQLTKRFVFIYLRLLNVKGEKHTLILRLFHVFFLTVYRKQLNERTSSYWLDGVKKNMTYVWNDGSEMIYKNLGGGRSDESSYTEGCISVVYGPGFLVPKPYSWLKGFCADSRYPIQYVCKGQNLNG